MTRLIPFLAGTVLTLLPAYGWAAGGESHAELSRILLGIHIAMSWRWLWAMTKRVIRGGQPARAGA